jgi:hypothetical protein
MAMLFLPLSTPFAFGLAKIQEQTASYTPAIIGFVCVLLIAAVLALRLDDSSSCPDANQSPEYAPN